VELLGREEHLRPPVSYKASGRWARVITRPPSGRVAVCELIYKLPLTCATNAEEQGAAEAARIFHIDDLPGFP
jgi:hypothetical protein